MRESYAVIMAGGKGERLRPLSTDERPKQFLPLLGERAMLQETVDRIKENTVDLEDCGRDRRIDTGFINAGAAVIRAS